MNLIAMLIDSSEDVYAGSLWDVAPVIAFYLNTCMCKSGSRTFPPSPISLSGEDFDTVSATRLSPITLPHTIPSALRHSDLFRTTFHRVIILRKKVQDQYEGGITSFGHHCHEKAHQQFLYEVDMCHEHATTTITLKPESIHGVSANHNIVSDF